MSENTHVLTISAFKYELRGIDGFLHRYTNYLKTYNKDY